MEVVVTAGEFYNIEDDTGQGLSIKAIESEYAMNLLRAYDAFRVIRATLGDDHEQTMAAFEAVERAFDEMPDRLAREMPSRRAGGIVIPAQY
jgi:hypothetical protein